MSTRELSRSRQRAPTPTALVLALLLLAGSSSWARAADGVRTTPPPTDDGGVHGEAAAADSGRRTDGPDRRTAASPPEDEGRPAAEREDLWATEEQRRAGATGSRLPDCAHACGACSPCRRVMVSFRCALQASESCPVAYRCMCRGRFFRVPSL